MGTVIGFVLLVVSIGLLYFLVIKPKMDNKDAEPPLAATPPKVLQEEQGIFLGVGNGGRPLWEFKYQPVHYGTPVNIYFGTSVSPVVATPNKDFRYDGSNGIVFKMSTETGKLRIHGSFGSANLRCVIKY